MRLLIILFHIAIEIWLQSLEDMKEYRLVDFSFPISWTQISNLWVQILAFVDLLCHPVSQLNICLSQKRNGAQFSNYYYPVIFLKCGSMQLYIGLYYFWGYCLSISCSDIFVRISSFIDGNWEFYITSLSWNPPVESKPWLGA